MAIKELERLLDRVPSWPDDAQAAALAYLRIIEKELHEPYELTDEDKASIERGLDDARHGRFMSDTAVGALFARFRLP